MIYANNATVHPTLYLPFLMELIKCIRKCPERMQTLADETHVYSKNDPTVW
jgi:hypothetical protein